MTTVSRVSQVSHSNVSGGGGGGGDWDHRLNRLLEDLQDSVIPTDTRRNASEYREFRMTSSTRVNDDPVQTVEEKWAEYGTRDGQGGGLSSTALPSLTSGPHNHHISNVDSAYSSNTTSGRYGAPEKSVAFSDESFGRNNYSSRSSHSHNIRNEYSSPSTSDRPGGQVEFLAPANTTTVLKSGPSSPSGYSVVPSSSSPKVERKEFYAKASYTTLIKGSGEPGDIPDLAGTDDNKAERLLEDLIPPDFQTTSSRPPANPPGLSSVSSSETRRTYITESRTGSGSNVAPHYDQPPTYASTAPIGQPLYSSTPMRTTSYSRDAISDRTRSVTPPPKPAEGLKTPPLLRKILQQSSSNTSSSAYNKSSTSYDSKHTPISGRPPLGGGPGPGPNHSSPGPNHSSPGGGIPSYDDPPEPKPARYYTSTTTTEHRTERELSPVRRFPSPHPKTGDGYGDPPKRLDDLLATFEDSSYHDSTVKYSGDGGGPHKSVPYGPGTHQITPVRQVRIDENVQHRQIVDDDSELVHRKNTTSYQNPAYGGGNTEVEHTRNISGPPVFYPPGQIFSKTEEESLMQSQEGGKGKGKMKAKREYKEKEKMKSKHSEKGGGGAVPVPVCLPVCCAAPCVIM